MRKKGLKILMAAAVLSLGVMSFGTYAATEGWALSNNTWTYLNSSGNKVTNEWKKGADQLWRYLDSKGEMAISTWADGEYYVDSNGIMVINQWVKTKPRWTNSGDEEWFYFGSNGKVVTGGQKKINGRTYLFDDDGIMQTGWSEDGIYYLGTDGAMKTGWRYLEPSEDEDTEEWQQESDDGKYWYYFSNNGKKYCPDTSDSSDLYKISRIDGNYYCFDENGRMQTGWVYLKGDPENAPSDSIEDWRYFAEEGIANVTVGTSVQGWLSLEAPERLQDSADEYIMWYYFEKKEGKPKSGPEFGDASTNDFVRINGKSYLFDPKGNPVSGLHKVEIASTGEYTTYYFDESSKVALKGKQTIEEADGTKSTFYFSEGSNAGRGYTGVKDNYLYYMGKRQEATNGVKYEAITIESGGTRKTYVVNSSGHVAKKKTVKDADGVKYTVDSSGVLTQVDGAAISSGETFGEPYEPACEEWDG